MIQCLLPQWPNSLKAKDANGNLALHLACCYQAPLNVIEYLAKQWPYSKRVLNSYGMTPLDCAKRPTTGKGAQADVVKWLTIAQKLEDANPFPWYVRPSTAIL